MATWGPVRIPNFTLKEGQSQSDASDDPTFSETPSLEAMREVKRNPFPANLLKRKNLTKPTLRKASSRSCRVHVLDIVGRTHDFLSRLCHMGCYGDLAVRRSRAQRKKDWDMAMLWLMDGNSTPPRDTITDQRIVISVPVVETILLPDHCRPTAYVNDLPSMLLITPSKSISLLTVESNMCFELEFMKSVVEEIKVLHGLGSNKEGDHLFSRILECFASKSSAKLVGQCSRKEFIEISVMKSTHSQNYISNGMVSESSPRSMLYSLLEKGIIPKELGPDRVLTKKSDIPELGHLKKYRVPFIESQTACTKYLRACSTKSPISGDVKKDIVGFHILKRDTVRRDRYDAEIGRPIFFRKGDSPNYHYDVKKLIGKVCKPKLRNTDMSTNDLFTSLSGYRRALLTCERSIWSQASQDIMARANYKRRRILPTIDRTPSLMLLSSHCLERSRPIPVDFGNEFLESAVFLRLAELVVCPSSKESRIHSLLDMLDFVAGLVSRSRQIFLNASSERVENQLIQYDPPIRKWGRVHFERILPRSELLKQCYEGVRESNIYKNGGKDDVNNDSDESALEVFSLSGNEFEEENAGADGFLFLKEVHEDLRHHSSFHVGTQGDTSKVQQQERGDLREPHIGTHGQPKVRLRVPDTLVCAPWVLQTAKQCIETMPRGAIFVPTSVSVLPVIAVVMNSHLRHFVRDQRVAVVCESQTDLADYIREYLNSSLGDSVSIDLIKRSECDGIASIAPLPHTSARVVLVDSFCFSFSAAFSLLIVLVTREAEVLSQDTRMREQLFESDVSQWVRIPFVLLAPIDSRIGLQSYSGAVQRLSKGLGAHQILWMKAKDDIQESVILSGPRRIFLAPMKEAIDLANLLTVHAAPHLRLNMNLRGTKSTDISRRTLTLLDVRFKDVQESMFDPRKSDGSGQHQRIELLYNFRQARTFAIYDGFNIAVAFLEHCFKQSKGQVRRGIKKVLEDLEDRKSELNSIPSTHPTVKALMKSMKEAESRMMQDPPSFRSVYRHDLFIPIIIANSEEAVNGCLQGFEDIVHLKHGTGSKAVCSLQELRSELKSQHSNVLQQRLEEFSHVFHIVDDRFDVPFDLLLPPVLQQQIHAGRTRLITLAVDETRKLDREEEREVLLYDKVTKSLGKEEEINGIVETSYLQLISIDSFRSAVIDVFPDSEEATEAQPIGLSDQSPDLNQKHDHVLQNLGALEMTPQQICSSSVENLREMLLSHLIISPKESTALRVSIMIKVGESCSPATTYLYSALAGNEELQQRVSVETIFLF